MLIKKPYFIAEISANHNGLLKNAKKLIREAKKYGADAVKLQTYKPETMTVDSKKKYFKIKSGLWKDYYLWDLYKKGHTPWSWHKELFNYAKKLKIKIFSTPFDETAVDFLEKLNCPFYKISSFEMTDLELIKKVASTKKDIIISTGMSSLSEIELSYITAKKYGAKNIILLYCVSNYPSKLDDFSLNNIRILKDKFRCRVGLSDHSKDNIIANTAVSLGATIFEKHIALEKQKKGLDIEFSLKGKEILGYRNILDKTYNLIKKNYFFRSNQELKNKRFRRSLFAIDNIEKGQKFTRKNIGRIRPGNGIDASFYAKLLHKKSPEFVKKHNPLKKIFLKKLHLI
jgi:pseudaminic acid synthase